MRSSSCRCTSSVHFRRLRVIWYESAPPRSPFAAKLKGKDKSKGKSLEEEEDEGDEEDDEDDMGMTKLKTSVKGKRRGEGKGSKGKKVTDVSDEEGKTTVLPPAKKRKVAGGRGKASAGITKGGRRGRKPQHQEGDEGDHETTVIPDETSKGKRGNGKGRAAANGKGKAKKASVRRLFRVSFSPCIKSFPEFVSEGSSKLVIRMVTSLSKAKPEAWVRQSARRNIARSVGFSPIDPSSG